MKIISFGDNPSRWLIICALTYLYVNAEAQKSASVHQKQTKIDLQVALQMSRYTYPSIKAKEAGVQSANYRVKESITEYIPELTTQNQVLYGTANGVRGAFFPAEGTAIPISGGIQSGQDWTATFGSFSTLILDWKFFNFGRINANVTAAKAEKQLADAEFENEIFQHQIKVIDTYLLFLIYAKLVQVQENNLQRAKVFRSVTLAKVRSGLSPGVDTSFSNAEYTKAEMLLMESIKNKRQQRIKFLELIGSENEDFEPDTMIFFVQVPTNENSENEQVKNNPLLKFYEKKVSLSKAKSIAISRSYLPSIGLMAAGWARGSGIDNKLNTDGSFNYNQSPGAGIPFKAYNYMVNVHFKWTISNYPKVRYQTMEQRFKTESHQFMYDEQYLKVKRSFEIAEMQYDLSYQQALKAPIQLNFARSAFDQAQGRYRAGLSNLVELTQNFYLLNRAEVDLSIANNNVWRALLLKAAATGDLSIFTDQAFK